MSMIVIDSDVPNSESCRTAEPNEIPSAIWTGVKMKLAHTRLPSVEFRT